MSPVFSRGYEVWEGEPVVPATYNEDLAAYIEELEMSDPEMAGFFKRLSRKVFRPIGRAVKKVAKVAVPIAITGGIGAGTVGKLFGRKFAGTIVGKTLARGVLGQAKGIFGRAAGSTAPSPVASKNRDCQGGYWDMVNEKPVWFCPGKPGTASNLFASMEKALGQGQKVSAEQLAALVGGFNKMTATERGAALARFQAQVDDFNRKLSLQSGVNKQQSQETLDRRARQEADTAAANRGSKQRRSDISADRKASQAEWRRTGSKTQGGSGRSQAQIQAMLKSGMTMAEIIAGKTKPSGKRTFDDKAGISPTIIIAVVAIAVVLFFAKGK
jgi:hypothetical protein